MNKKKRAKFQMVLIYGIIVIFTLSFVLPMLFN